LWANVAAEKRFFPVFSIVFSNERGAPGNAERLAKEADSLLKSGLQPPATLRF
jgi:hypothetical protein